MQTQWDLETQEFHGGQSWRNCDTFVADFSVTTNPLGAPSPAVKAAETALSHIHHYPAVDASDAKTAIARFCQWQSSCMLLGNGASEFIDLVMRALPDGPFVQAPYIATYQEYHRAARVTNRRILTFDDYTSNCHEYSRSTSVCVIIRPNSPTGELMTLPKLEHVLQRNSNMYVVVDESFLPFAGPHWRQLSALSLIERYPDRLIVIHSWTKVFSCAGLRLGSICASGSMIKLIKSQQVPWSCNSIAQAFAVSAMTDTAFLTDTWDCTRKWRPILKRNIEQLGWKIYDSEDWVPWFFILCPSEQVAAKAAKVAMSVGCPVRHCASYGLPSYIRVAVRKPESQAVLFKTWRKHFEEESHSAGGEC